jgi:predicted DNA binding CopG/RHH family protein
MSKKIRCDEGPIREVRVVRDFLPAPADLVFKEEQVKVTIGLSKASVDFFKEEARRHHTQYQKMIRRLLDLYVAQHQS